MNMRSVWMHAYMFAVASSFRWQTLTVSASIFAHLENVCLKTEREKIAHLQRVVGNYVGRMCMCKAKGSRWRRRRITIFSPHAEALRDSFSDMANSMLFRDIHSASLLKQTWAEKLNNEFSQGLGSLACQAINGLKQIRWTLFYLFILKCRC